MKLPYVYIPPDGPMSPLVVSVPHAGTRIPAEDEALIVADQTTILRDADLHVDKLYAKAAELGAAYLGCTVSRYVLDVNRGPTDVDARLCPEWPNGGNNSKSLIWRLSTDGTEVQGRRLTKAEVDSRIERVHVPYHAKLKALLDERRDKFGYAVLLEAHSMPSVGRSEHSDTGQLLKSKRQTQELTGVSLWKKERPNDSGPLKQAPVPVDLRKAKAKPKAKVKLKDASVGTLMLMMAQSMKSLGPRLNRHRETS